MPTLDCRGLDCPQPVIKLKELLDSDAVNAFDSVEALVDNLAAKENLTRYFDSRGFVVDSTAVDGGFRVVGTRIVCPASEQAPATVADHAPSRTPTSSGDKDVTVFLTSETIGSGDDVLGQKLMGNFLATLPEMIPVLRRIVMVNGAVKLAVDGSAVLDKIKVLEAAGVRVLVCGACLEHFGLAARRAVGETTNMLDIVAAFERSDSVIRP